MNNFATVVLGASMMVSFLLGQGEVSGTVTDSDGKGIPVANVYLEGTSLGTATDRAGNYTIGDVPAGDYVLVASAMGYRTARGSISLTEGERVVREFSLSVDVIRLGEVVTTATRSPLTKVESSVAITTFSTEDIRRNEPRSTADLLSNVPGFYVESSGGQVGNNLFARGLPADGSYRYVALMEDGMPVYDETELYFVNADIFVRLDDNIDRVEAIRGGNSALFGHNNPGGVINFIDRTGGPETVASLRLTGGTDGFFRTDFNMNGPFNGLWRYNIGGFYRYDEGLRVTGMPVSKGGQLKGNVTRLFDNGYVRVHVKYLNDSNTFYLGLPVMGKAKGGKFVLTDKFVKGFPSRGSMATEEANLLRVPTPEGYFTMPLEDGQKQVGRWLLGDVKLDLAGGWKVRNMSRWMDVEHGWNAVLPFSVSETQDVDDVTYAGTLTAVTEKYVASSGLWHVAMPLTNFSNQFQLQKNFQIMGKPHSVTLGHYFGRHTQGSFWFWQNIMTTVPDSSDEFARLVDVEGSQNGFTQYGSMYLNANGGVSTRALYAGDDIRVRKNLRVNMGIRTEKNDLRNYAENERTFDLGDVTTRADDAVLWGDGTFRQAEAHFSNIAYSIGVNYLVNDTLSAYARLSRGYKTPMASEIMWSRGDVSSGEGALEAEILLQGEAGVKMSRSKFGLSLAAYWLRLTNFPSSDAQVVTGSQGQDTTIFEIDYVGEAKTLGLEIEGGGRFGPLMVIGNFTFQNHRYTHFLDPTEQDRNFSGNRVKRIPRVIFNSAMSYERGRLVLGGKWVYTGLRYANTANDIELPGFGVINLSAAYKLTGTTSAKVNILNALNGNGLTEGNPRKDETGAYETGPVLARPILPRRIQLSMAFNF
ncbi:MAG: TonB-dependent receptor [Fidelibacterota bacterium]